MTDLPYDPELPFAVVDTVGKVEARFKEKSDAKIWIHDVAGYGEVVDTTPKPKIPEDAEYIFITSEDNEPMFANRDDSSWYWHTTGEYITFRDLVEYVGDAEVTVLVRKEES